MQVAQYKGISWTSRAIKFMTRGPYSHSAFVFTGATAEAAGALWRELGNLKFVQTGAVVEAWLPKVRNVPSISSQHTPGTVVDFYDFDPPLTPYEEAQLLRLLNQQIGLPYDVRDVLRFVTRRPGRENNRLFCSEMVFGDALAIGRVLLRRTRPWEVPPSWIQRSNEMKYDRTMTTT